jgi:VIT1/CCC1 family predicted Fe2+/Mn2+ transporter
MARTAIKRQTSHAKDNELTKKEIRLLQIETKIGKAAIQEYVNYLHSPSRIFWANLLAGLARGIGFVLGGTVLVALLAFLLIKLTAIPVIGEWFRWMAESIGNPNL